MAKYPRTFPPFRDWFPFSGIWVIICWVFVWAHDAGLPWEHRFVNAGHVTDSLIIPLFISSFVTIFWLIQDRRD